MQHAARQPGVERGEPGADFLAQQLVLHAGQPVGVARQHVQPLRVEQQRAAAHLVLDELLGQRLDERELVHAFAEVQAQRLRAPAGQQAERAQRGQVVAESHFVSGQARERLAQFFAWRLPIDPVP